MKIISKQKKARRNRLGLRGAAFSLIEVTISIAITAVALVSLMGMLPAGMRIMREAGDRAVETRIHQEVLSEIMLAAWDARYEFDYKKAGLRFYDDQGILLETTPGDDEFDFSHVYTARVNVPVAGTDSLPNSLGNESYEGVIVPGESVNDPNLQLIIVEITSVLDPAMESPTGFDNPNFKGSIRTFQATMTKMGKNFK